MATVDITLANLLAGADEPCNPPCRNGWIDNGPAVRIWETEHAETLERYQEERRARRSACVGAEESALTSTRPPHMLECPCRGAGRILTDDGRALMAFVERHWGRR